MFTLLTLGILAEAAIFQVTSYVPEDNNIFFHSFAFVFIFSGLTRYIPVNLNQLSYRVGDIPPEYCCGGAPPI